jgi:Flp pilus assembly protein TadG
MQTGISQPSRSRQAAAAAEFAILLPFLAFVFLLAVDLCRAFYVTQVVQNCAYAGAMYASQVSASSSSPQTAAQQAAVAEGACLNPALTTSQVTYTAPDSNNNIKVTVTYTFNTLTTYPGIQSSWAISRTVTMRVAPS